MSLYPSSRLHRILLSAAATLVGFAIGYLAWGMMSVTVFDRVLDAGAMLVWPGLATLGLWALVIVPLAALLGADDPRIQPGPAARMGLGAALALVVLTHAVAALETGPDPVRAWRLVPAVGAMMVATALVQGGVT